MEEQGHKQQERQELLEVYKLHVELADRVSQRRDGVNRLYVSLMVGSLVFLATVLRFLPDGSNGIFVVTALAGTGVMGATLAASWFSLIRSYDHLNEGQYEVLRNLERRLAYPFITEQFKRERKGRSPYRELAAVGAIFPWIWVCLFGSLVTYALVVGSRL